MVTIMMMMMMMMMMMIHDDDDDDDDDPTCDCNLTKELVIRMTTMMTDQSTMLVVTTMPLGFMRLTTPLLCSPLQARSGWQSAWSMDLGGVRGMNGDFSERGEVYYIGIIDILQVPLHT
jgi:hypothetical protein